MASRIDTMSFTVAMPSNADFVDGVATKDIEIGSGSQWVRIYRPEQPPDKLDKYPVVFYVHGGAYNFGQPDWRMFHHFCTIMCRLTGMVWLSISYRLAPQYRLPVAYKDALTALKWMAKDAPSADPWLDPALVDYQNTILCGESTGASILLNLAMTVGPDLSQIQPLSVRGVTFIQPGLHTERKRGVMLEKGIGNLAIDTLYDFALPAGETLNYPPVNPLHENSPPLSPLGAFPKIFIATATDDFRYDLTQTFYQRVKSFCADTELFVTEGKPHIFHIFQPQCAETKELLDKVAQFINSCVVHST